MNDKTKVIKKKCLQIIMVIIFTLPLTSLAQNEEKNSSLEVTGSADVYFTYDFSEQDNIPTSFSDNRNSLSIGMLDV
ncbi:hypothetical protein MNBD_BACTEROID06-274, partial [hydrothermal vent metagenome]